MAQPKGETTMAITKRYRNKKTFYQAELFVKGVRITTKNFSTKREAVFWQETERHKLKLNSLNFNNYMTFEDCVNRFFEDAKARMILSTSQKYESQKTYFCSSPLAKVKMSELKGFKIVEWIGWLKKQPTAKNPRRKSFIKEYKLLKTILIWYKNFLNEDFNVPITKKHRQLCVFKQNAPRRPDYFMRPEDAKAWIEWLKENRSNPVYWRLAVFLLSTGTRVSEACGIKWDAIDLKRGFVRIVRRVHWDHFNKHPVLEDVTKTAGSARLLMLPEGLKDILKEIKKEAMNDLVFTDSKGELLRYNAVQSAFNAGFKALGLPWRSTHICRHTFATVALMATKDISAVQASLGHTEIKMTQRYAKTIALLSSETGEKTSSIFFQSAKK